MLPMNAHRRKEDTIVKSNLVFNTDYIQDFSHGEGTRGRSGVILQPSLFQTRNYDRPQTSPGLHGRGRQTMGMRLSPAEAVPGHGGRLASPATACDGIQWEAVLTIKECHFQDGSLGYKAASPLSWFCTKRLCVYNL